MARILIVDDSTVQRSIMKKFIQKEKHEVVGEANNGQDVVGLYQELKPDIVLLDIVMPDANGITVLDQIMAYDKNANVIMCSATALKNVIIESIQLGAKGFLVKPITRDALARAISRIQVIQDNKQNV